MIIGKENRTINRTKEDKLQVNLFKCMEILIHKEGNCNMKQTIEWKMQQKCTVH